jgi:DNA adenine methylase
LKISPICQGDVNSHAVRLAMPFLRWAGSKRKSLRAILSLVPQSFDRYIEPFAGSACLFFALMPRKAILGDINVELINVYRTIITSLPDVLENLKQLNNSEDVYYHIRSLDTSRLSSVERAARFIYLNRFCFNGLYRTNKKGHFNVPYGGDRSGQLPSADTLYLCAQALKKASFVAGNFDKTLKKARPNDFIYLDPPYCIKDRRIFNEYSHFNFGEAELGLLRQHLVTLDQRGIPFLVSYGASQEAKYLAAGFRYREIDVRRQIAGFSGNRRNSREFIITNY